MIPHLDLPIAGPDDIARARHAALQVAIEHHLDESARGRVAVIVTELAAWLAAQAIEGRLLIGCHAADEGAQVEILVLTRGPDEPDLARRVRDQERASGPDVAGLPLARRLASDFAVFTAPGQGTILLARSWAPVASASSSRSPAARFSHAGISLASPDESLSSNAWHLHIGRGSAEIVVCDADCDGEKGAEAATVVTHAFRQHRLAPCARLAHAHPLMREATCGASVATAALDSQAGTLVFCGVGNLSARIVSIADDHVLESLPGKVGGELPEMSEKVHAWPRDSVVVFHSSGLDPAWRFDGVESLLKCDPAVIAAWLVREYQRRHDLVVVVLKRT